MIILGIPRVNGNGNQYYLGPGQGAGDDHRRGGRFGFEQAVVSQTPFIFDGSIEENLLYGCISKEDADSTGQPRSLPNLDQMIETVQQTGLFSDLLRFGLNSMLNLQQ